MADSEVARRLGHILDAIKTLETAFKDADDLSLLQSLPRRWVLERGFEIISEASRYIPDAAKARFAIDWRGVRDIGNVLRHGYEVVSPERLWDFFVDDIPPLKAVVEQLYREFAETP